VEEKVTKTKKYTLTQFALFQLIVFVLMVGTFVITYKFLQIDVVYAYLCSLAALVVSTFFMVAWDRKYKVLTYMHRTYVGPVYILQGCASVFVGCALEWKPILWTFALILYLMAYIWNLFYIATKRLWVKNCNGA